MALIMTGFGDKGDINNERIGFQVSLECNLKNYILFQTVLTSGGFYNKSQATYWFAPEIVKAGDRVVVCTRHGQDSFQINDDGSKTYFRYWGLDSPIFTDHNSAIVLGNITDWTLSSNI